MEVSVQWDVLIKTVVAMGLAGLIGFERELKDKPAGLRTHMFVAAAAALLVALSEEAVGRFAERLPDAVAADPIRIFQTIIVGVSFIGAGTIIQREHEERVEGLTTAASLLLVAGIGIAVALDMAPVAAAIVVAVLIVGVGLRRFERRVVEDEGEE